MGWERSFTFIGVLIAIVFVLENISLLSPRSSPLAVPQEHSPLRTEPRPARVTKIAICILSRRSEWQRRHLARQTWLQVVPDGAQVSHVFVLGEDRSYTADENSRLKAEAERHEDILIAPVEEASDMVAAKTKYCIDWTTSNHEFDILVKTEDDSTLFLSRLFGHDGWLPPRAVDRDELVYFGKRHKLAKVPNPASLAGSTTEKSLSVGQGSEAMVEMGTDGLFEFDYKGVYWPEHVEGGMYGLSRGLAEQIATNDFRTYSNEAATFGIWVSAFHTKALYLADEQVLSQEEDYFASNGTVVAASFGTCRLRQASMWCEYTDVGTLSPPSIQARDAEKALVCLGKYEGSGPAPLSLPLVTRENLKAPVRQSLDQRWRITQQPSVEETGRWWGQMRGAFRGIPAAVVGTSAAVVDRLPLYLLQGTHTLVMDDFFRVSERYRSWKPTMYMCVDPEICASRDGRADDVDTVSADGRTALPKNPESANKFARDVLAAFYVLGRGPGGAEYWRYLRQRSNAHWFVAGGGSHGFVAARRAGIEVGEGGVVAGIGRLGVAGRSPNNFRSVSQTSGLAMAVELLSYLGFSPIYITAAKEELDGRGGGGSRAQQWDEFSSAIRLVGSTYGTSVIYLYADDEDKLRQDRVFSRSGSASSGDAAAQASAALGKFSGQEHIMSWAMKRDYALQAKRPSAWDMEIFLRNFPIIGRLKIVRDASSVQDMFPGSPPCRDAQDLDRYQKAIICPVNISLKHFSSFLSWHVPYGPLRGQFVWVKR